jgi:hypothetical protein
LDGFESQTAQTSSQFFPIPSNPCVLGITEQALTGLRNQQQRTSPRCIGPNKLRRCVATQQVAKQNMQRIEGLVYVIHCQKTTLTCGEDRGRSRSYAHSRFKRCGLPV